MTFVYDGHCVLCSAMARHVLACDPNGRIRLVAAQSPEGKALYRAVGLATDTLMTNLFVERDGRILTHSASSLRILEEIGYSSTLTRAARLVPTPLRDWVYSLVARSRFRLFGRHETCQFVSRPEIGLYRHLLGTEAFERLPQIVRRMHDVSEQDVVMVGAADITRGGGFAAWFICTVCGLPRSGILTPLSVRVSRHRGGERWVRSFNGRTTTSRQYMSQQGELTERFGPMLIAVNLKADVDGLLMSPRKAWLAGIPLPAILTPRGYGRESAIGTQYRFEVEIGWCGRVIVHYTGHLDYAGAVAP